jgi:hypothetical protein
MFAPGSPIPTRGSTSAGCGISAGWAASCSGAYGARGGHAARRARTCGGAAPLSAVAAHVRGARIACARCRVNGSGACDTCERYAQNEPCYCEIVHEMNLGGARLRGGRYGSVSQRRGTWTPGCSCFGPKKRGASVSRADARKHPGNLGLASGTTGFCSATLGARCISLRDGSVRVPLAHGPSSSRPLGDKS